MRWRVVQVFLWHLCLLVTNVSCAKGVVRRLSPSSGSLCGGNRLSIYGSGFAKDASANQVEIGGAECKVETVSDDKLVCQVGFRDGKVVTGKESVAELVSVRANGEPLSGKLEFTFKAESSPIIVDWGPATGQANDVLSFQGKDKLSGTSVALGGAECKVKQSDGIYLQCVPPPREAGVSTIEVNFGPDRGFACPGPKAPPLKFTYNLGLQSALSSELGGDPEGPLDGGGQLTAGPCSPRSPSSGLLTIVGQGLGNSTIFKLCGGDAWCTPEGPVTPDPAMYHSGDWSFQTVACRPGPLDPTKAPGGSRTCELTAEAAEGMFVATLPDAWTYGPTDLLPTTTVAADIPQTDSTVTETEVALATTTSTAAVLAGATQMEVASTTGFVVGVAVDIDIGTAQHEVATIKSFGSLVFGSPLKYDHPAGTAVTMQAQVYIGGASPAAVPLYNPVVMSPAAAPPAPPAQAFLPMALAPVPAPAPSVYQVPPPVPTPKRTPKRQLKKMAQKVLSRAFESIADALSSPNSQTQPLQSGQLPPPYPVSQEAFQAPAELSPPPPLPTMDPPPGLQAAAPAPAAAEAMLQEAEAELMQLRGAWRHL